MVDSGFANDESDVGQLFSAQQSRGIHTVCKAPRGCCGQLCMTHTPSSAAVCTSLPKDTDHCGCLS